MQNKNYGFIQPIIKPEDFFLGSGKLGTKVINESGDWRSYLPVMEYQNQGNETNCCVSFGTLSVLEILHKFYYGKEPNYSDRFLCVMSETKGGNTPNKVSDTLRHSGCVPEEEWPFVIPLNEFFREIPQNIKDMGIDWLKDFEVGYEWVSSDKLKEALKRSPISVAVYAWATNDKGEYIRLGPSTHYVVLVAFDEQDRPIIFDSYDTGLKTLDKNHNLEFPQIWVLKKKKGETRENWWRRLWESIRLLFNKLPL